MPSPDPTRTIAFGLLDAVLSRRRSLDEALDAAGPADPRDRAAAHRLAATVLRRLGTLDAVLEPFLRRAPPEGVRHALRIGAAQLLLLGTPPHAAVGTAVALARSRGFTPFAGLVNAVLRRVAAAGSGALDALDGPRLDTPAWLWASWGADARAIATAHASEAPLDVTPAPGAILEGGAGLPNGTVRFPPGTRPTELPGFAAGAFWVQDAAATLPVRLLRPAPGQRVADLCAAPGGKTAQLAAAGALVTAIDRDGARLHRLRENLARLHLPAEIVEADALSWQPPAPLDAVLLDAPCTATGTVRRHPDVLRLRRPSDLSAVTAGQDALLRAAAAMLRPGGTLVYAVCSLQPEEGPARAAAAAGFGLVPDPVGPDELPELHRALTEAGAVRTHPGLWPEHGGMDGFFIARFGKP